MSEPRDLLATYLPPLDDRSGPTAGRLIELAPILRGGFRPAAAPARQVTASWCSSTEPNPVAVIPHADGSVSVDDRHTAAFDARFLYDVADPDLVARCIQEIASAAS